MSGDLAEEKQLELVYLFQISSWCIIGDFRKAPLQLGSLVFKWIKCLLVCEKLSCWVICRLHKNKQPNSEGLCHLQYNCNLVLDHVVR